MEEIMRSDKLKYVHSDIRGPVFVEALKMEKEGTKVLKLNTGNPATFGFKMPDSVRNALLENADKAVGYCDLRGMPASREAIYEYHKKKGIEKLERDHIFIGNGVSELVSMVTTALLNDGDEVLVPCPCYSLWSNTVKIAGGVPVHYICDESSDWYPDMKDIRSKITPRTRAIVIINPNNPTGALYPDEVLLEIVKIAKENNLIICADEIYDRLLLDGKKHTALASLSGDLPVITFNGLSKSHIICGFRCGWMCVSGDTSKCQDFIAGLVALAAMRLCSSALMQLVIPAALEDNASTQAMMVPGGRLWDQREACCSAMDKIEDITYVKNSGAFYIFPKFDAKKHNITDDRKFAMDLLKAKHILIVPGSGFDWPEPNHFRVVMLPEAEKLHQAMLEIGDFLETYKQ